VPTKIEIGANPLFKLKGAIKEIGNMVLWTDPNSGIAANEYSVKVDFVQMIVMKAKIKTNISGSIQFQTCTDEMCLQPKTIKFSIPVMP
jgi:thiol:disulfide interchange protein DsbD